MKKRTVEDDHLERLPDELLLHIFDRVQDAKCLKRCLAVSRRFKSLVPLTPTVSISIGCSLALHLAAKLIPPNPNRQVEHLRRLKAPDAVFTLIPLGTKLRFTCPYNFHISGEPFRISTVNDQLKGFKGIQRLRVNQIEPPAYWDDCDMTLEVFNCKMELGGATQLIRRCIVVDFSENAYHSFPPSKGESTEEGSMIPESIVEVTKAHNKLTMFLIETACMHTLLGQIAARNPTVRDVVVIDACRNVKLHAGEDEMADMRMRAVENRMPGLIRDMCFKLWHVPVLRLPESGRLLTGVNFVVMMSWDPAASRTVDGYRKFLKSYLEGDVGMQEDRDDKERELLIREVVMEMSKKIDTLPYLERDMH